MKIKKILLATLSAVIFAELGSVILATHSRSSMRNLLITVDHLTMGIPKKDVEVDLRSSGLSLVDEACATSSGSCEGFGVVIHNYPLLASPRLSDIVSKILVFRPTVIETGFYFKDQKLDSITVKFESDDASVGAARYLGSLGKPVSSKWRETGEQHRVTSIRIVDPDDRKGGPTIPLKTFKSECMVSILGCDSALSLWPVAPHDTGE